jgi:dTDP-4-dehydrorhamnose reductase
MITTQNQIPFGIYHCTDIGEITWWDFANKIYELGKKHNRISHDCTINACTTSEYPTAAKRPAYSVLSKDKIQKALNIQLSQWEESLESFIKSDRFVIK